MPTDRLLMLAAGLGAVLFLASAVAFFAPGALRGMADALRALVRRPMVLALVGVAVYYGGAKPSGVQHADADAGVGLYGVYYDYDSTNDVTTLQVRYANGVTTSTPVSYRPDQRHEWTAAAKTDPVITQEGTTNVLTFTTSGNVGTNAWWYVGTELPPIIIETSGIEITHYEASSSSVSFTWQCEDPRATSFQVQRRHMGSAEAWETVMTTTLKAGVFTGFTVGESWEYRIMSTYVTGGDE